jgi:hypothetical protein
MSKKNELGVFQHSIAIPGVTFTRTELKFEHVDEDALVKVGSFLQAVDACSAWWWGDFLVAYCGYNVGQEERELKTKFDEITHSEKLKQYSAKYSMICDREPKTLAHWRGVADFFNSSRRREELSHGHHIEAQNGSDGDTAVADNWLDLAVKNRWSVSQLRANIRQQKRAALDPDEPMPQLILPLPLVECGRWAGMARKRVDDMDLSEAKALLAELQPILNLSALLAAKVVAAEGGGKESLTTAPRQR